MTKISPSILTANFAYIGDAIMQLNNSEADYIHCDIMDGIFVPNISFGLPVIKDIRPLTNKVLDVHLMIQEPLNYIDEFSSCGADIITIHAECQSATHLQRALSKIKANGKKAGVALNPATNPYVLDYVFGDIDLILIMSVNPGFGGQKFIPQVLYKIEEVANKVSKLSLPIEIEVDGGVNFENARLIKDAGANVLVAGSAVFNGNNIIDNVSKLKSSL